MSWDAAPSDSPQRFGFLLTPGFALGGLSAALEVVAALNEQLGQTRYRTVLLSEEGDAVESAQGAQLQVNDSLHAGMALDALFVLCGPPQQERPWSNGLVDTLRTLAALGVVMGGMGCGASLLARAGLLRGYRATQHWEYLEDFTDAYPHCTVSARLYEIDRNRLSCGNVGVADMLLGWFGQRHGSKLVNEVAAQLGMERIRPADERQRLGSDARAVGGSAHLTEALALMEANLEEPLATEEIARLIGVSRRQLERLFKQHLDELPSRYYLGLRLKRARRMLQQSSQSVMQIGLACGFASGPHFSTVYRAHFGRSPRDERADRVAYWRTDPNPSGD